MTTYYVDFVNGADANNGLGPDASAGTNKPWKTVTKLLGASGMASGDTAYLAPVTFRETVSVAMTSATVETKIIGDCANAQGFKTSGGVLLPPGEVQITAYTTNDKTTPSATVVLGLSTRDFLTFQNITFVGGSASPGVLAVGGDATNHTFTDCTFIQGQMSANISSIAISNTTAVPLHWLFDRCRFLIRTMTVTAVKHVSADYDLDIVYRNCLVMGFSVTFDITTSGASSFSPGGVLIIGCTIWTAGNPAIRTNSAGMSTSIPCKVENSIIICPTGGITANTSGQITEQFNVIYATSARTNVTAGTGSISDGSYALLTHIGQENAFGAQQRHVFTPTKGSPFLAFGSSASAQAVDLLNRPRPAGGVSASKTVGALERGNTFGLETGTVRTGSNAISITGPGYQDFDVAVDATSTTVTVYMRFDSTYAGTKPVISVLNGEEEGVSPATSSAVTTVNTWEQLSLTFTPTSKGVVTIRLTSTDTNGGGKAFADDFAVT